MADDSVQVKLGADTSAATSGMENAQQSIANSLDAMQRALVKFTEQSAKTHGAVKEHTDGMSAAFAALHENVRLRFGSINSLVEQFSTKLAAVGAVLAGGALFSAMVSHLIEFNKEVTTLENVMGMASDKATEFAIALRIAGSSAEAYTGLALKMARQLKSNEEEFNRNKIATRDSTNSLLPLDTIMQNAFTRMQQLKAGTDQAEFALQFFGRSVEEVYRMIVILPAAQERARQLMADMNVEFGPEKQAQLRQYQIEVGAFKEMIGITADEIGVKVIPHLQNLAKYFNETGPAAAQVFIKVMTGLLVTTDFVANGFAELSAKLKNLDQQNLVSEATYWAAAKALFTDGWAAASAIWDAGMKKRERIQLEGNAEILGMEADLQKRLALLGGAGGPGKPGPGPLGTGKDSFVPKPKTAAASDIGGWDAVLKASESAYNNLKIQQGSFETWSEDMTRDYWAQVLEFATLSAKDRQEVQNKYYDSERKVQQAAFAAYLGKLEDEKAALGHNIDAKIAIEQKEYDAVVQRYGAESVQAAAAYKKLVDLRQQLADQRNKIADIELKAQEATAKHDIEMNKLAADQAVSLKQISATQRLAIEKQFIAQSFQAEVDGINARIAAEAADPNSDPTKLAELKAQLLKVEQEYQKQLTQIDNAAVLEREKYAIQAQDAITSSISNTLAALVTGAKSWKQTMLDALKQLDDALVKIAANKVTEQFFGAGTSGGDFISKLVGSLGFGGGSATPQIAAETANTSALALLTSAITANTAALAASSASSLGGGVGGLFSGGGGFGFGDLVGGLASFDVGTPYVPQDTLAFVHKGEAVIPAAYNRPGIGGGMAIHNHFNITGPVDTRTQTQIAAAASIGVRRGAARNL